MKQKQPCQLLSEGLLAASNVGDAVLMWASKQAKCPSCGRMNDDDSRYCTQCGSILKQVFCSLCGTANPDSLGSCLQCGNTLPDMSTIRWGPSVKVLHPTQAMIEKEEENRGS